jgi:N-acetylmuramoyl-L-alanine amidase
MKTKTLLLLLACIASGCAVGPPIDTRYSSPSHQSRVKYVVIHYTVGDFASSLATLTEPRGNSSHYLVDVQPPTIYRLVDESRRAHHAGVSSWKGDTNLNLSSIGIEIVNSALQTRPTDDLHMPYPDLKMWMPYPDEQIAVVIELVRKIVAEHRICPQCILAHSDIAPQRKQDPGPLFPWKRLADAGLMPWPDAALVSRKRPDYELSLPDIDWFQRKLAEHGFAVPQNGQYDEATQHVLAAFQMKYRPSRFDGVPDAETAAILDVLTSAPANAS